MQIITGKTDTAHVRSEDDRALHAGMVGTGNYILNVGSRLAASIETANNIVIADGELLFQGTHARIRYGETDTCIIENGTTGYNRIDLIVARYTQVAGLESITLEVIKGEATAGEPSEPAYTPGNILEGATLAEVPIYAVRISGVNVVSVTSKIPILYTSMDNTYTKEIIDEKLSEKQNIKDLTFSYKHIKQALTCNVTETSYQTKEVELEIPNGYSLTGINDIVTLDAAIVEAYIVSIKENGTTVTLGFTPQSVGEFRIDIFLSCQRITK